MNNIKKRILLSREAMLFDSPLYILKGFLSMMTAYFLFNDHYIIGKDMISVFFGMMMTLEPVNVSGLKSGFGQVQATILGGVVTAVIIYFFGVNWLTIPLAVAITMYISLVLNWRIVSPVAIFTAIYMTQLIQTNAVGDPSMLLTLRLRMFALAAGIIVALFYNYVFSQFFYKTMLNKRIVFLIESFLKVLDHYDSPIIEQKKMTASFITEVDSMQGVFADFKKEKGKAVKSHRLLWYVRDLSHYWMDHIMDLDENEAERIDTSSLVSLLTATRDHLEKKVIPEISLDESMKSSPKLFRAADKIMKWTRGESI
ncbi:MAG: hypothetical protein K8R73_11645 [Clostridiales bacterium]|jgi:hypothetical protein|nr:hypothetical protein [Clostridiales bacterium]